MKMYETNAIETRAISVAGVAKLARHRSQRLRSDSRNLCQESQELRAATIERLRVLPAAKRVSNTKIAGPACPAQDIAENAAGRVQ